MINISIRYWYLYSLVKMFKEIIIFRIFTNLNRMRFLSNVGSEIFKNHQSIVKMNLFFCYPILRINIHLKQ